MESESEQDYVCRMLDKIQVDGLPRCLHYVLQLHLSLELRLAQIGLNGLSLPLRETAIIPTLQLCRILSGCLEEGWDSYRIR